MLEIKAGYILSWSSVSKDKTIVEYKKDNIFIFQRIINNQREFTMS